MEYFAKEKTKHLDKSVIFPPNYELKLLVKVL